MTVISLCDRTGNMVRPWAEAGFKCICVDMQHPVRNDVVEGNITFTYGDVRTWTPPEGVEPCILFAFPPCTHVNGAGARDHVKKGTALLCDALECFSACETAGRWAGVPYLIENPVGKLSTHIRKPEHLFQPWQYGDLYTKKTCLWTGGGFVMPKPVHDVEPEGVEPLIHKMPPSDDRGDLRSITPPGFAQAVFEANYRRCEVYGKPELAGVDEG